MREVARLGAPSRTLGSNVVAHGHTRQVSPDKPRRAAPTHSPNSPRSGQNSRGAESSRTRDHDVITTSECQHRRACVNHRVRARDGGRSTRSQRDEACRHERLRALPRRHQAPRSAASALRRVCRLSGSTIDELPLGETGDDPMLRAQATLNRRRRTAYGLAEHAHSVPDRRRSQNERLGTRRGQSGGGPSGVF
jgi:hypothetical protein